MATRMAPRPLLALPAPLGSAKFARLFANEAPAESQDRRRAIPKAESFLSLREDPRKKRDDHQRRDIGRDIGREHHSRNSRHQPAPPPRGAPDVVTAEVKAEEYENAKFEDFPLHPDLQKRLQEVGFQKPFPVQAATFPYSLVGKDVIARAFTGSGKTLAFTIPVIQRLAFPSNPSSASSSGHHSPRAILLSPTRELGLQIYDEIKKISGFIRCVALYGGSSISTQQRDLRRGVDVVIGTPGRINDLIERGNLDLSKIEIFVLDEADQMMGNDFRDQVESIMSETPKERQTLLFSATMPSSVKSLTRNFMRDPILVDLLKGNRVPSTVTHLGMPMRPGQSKFKAIGDTLLVKGPEKAIIFCNSRVESSKLALYLSGRDIPCEALHSDLSQSQRERSMSNFRDGRLRAIIATDVAARGIDVPNCDLVIHCEPPSNGFEFYIHRSGRTGRAGKSGESLVLYSRADRDFLRDLEKTGIDLIDIDPPKDEEVMEKAINNEIKKMEAVPKKLVDKLTPAAQKLFEEQGIAALAKALVISSKFQPEKEVDSEDRRARFGGDRDRDRDRGGSRFGGGDRDRRFGGDRDRDRSGSRFGGDRDRFRGGMREERHHSHHRDHAGRHNY